MSDRQEADGPASSRRTRRAAAPRDRGRLQDRGTASAPDYRRQNKIPDYARHRGERAVDGVRQQGRRLRHRRGVHARPRHRREQVRTATTSRTRRARTSSPASATPCRSRSWRRAIPKSYDELREAMKTLESHYSDMCDIEFTVEEGRLWILQTRVGKRTAFGRVGHRLRHGRRGPDRRRRGAAARRRGNRLDELFKRGDRREPRTRRADRHGPQRIARARRSARCVHRRRGPGAGREGERVILVRRETTPDDYHGMVAAQGILTSRRRDELARGRRGARRGHPGGVRRRRDQASTAADEQFTANGTAVREGDVITIDGSPATSSSASCRSRNRRSRRRARATPRARTRCGVRSSAS